MRASFRIGRIAGIDIGVHYTWLLAFFLIAWSLSVGFFPQLYPGWTTLTYWVTGIISALCLFISVLLHELAHSLVARARGMSVNSITLFIFGGVSNLEGEPERPVAEFAMAIVGPLTSLVLAGVFWSLSQVITSTDSIIKAIVTYLAIINALLAAFNLIPGFPLDGGRVLRSIIWGATRDMRKATNIAATVGQFFGWGFIAFGVYSLFTGNFLGGLWIAFIGWFLSSAADASRRDVSMRERLQGVKVGKIMDNSPRCLSPSELVADIVRDVFFQQGVRAAAVCEQERVIGIITITDVKRLHQSRWNDTAVTEIMTREPLYSVSADDDLNTALRLLAQHELNQLLVLERGRLVGLLNRAHVIRYIQLSQELRLPLSRGKSPTD